jgi:hypothetical protein
MKSNKPSRLLCLLYTLAICPESLYLLLKRFTLTPNLFKTYLTSIGRPAPPLHRTQTYVILFHSHPKKDNQ